MVTDEFPSVIGLWTDFLRQWSEKTHTNLAFAEESPRLCPVNCCSAFNMLSVL